MEVQFGGKSIYQNATITDQEAQQQIGLTWGGQVGELYTIVMYNMATGKLNYLAVNVPGEDIPRSKVIVPYQAPTSELPQSQFAIVILKQQPGRKVDDVPQLDVGKLAQQANLIQVANRIFSVKGETAKEEPIKPVKETPKVTKEIDEGSTDHSTWLKENPLTEQQQKFCRCTIQVAGKQPTECLIEKAWFERRNGYKCANPYPICAKSVGTTNRECSKYYNFSMFPNAELQGYAHLHGIPVPEPYNRTQLLKNISQWKAQKYGE